MRENANLAVRGRGEVSSEADPKTDRIEETREVYQPLVECLDCSVEIKDGFAVAIGVVAEDDDDDDDNDDDEVADDDEAVDEEGVLASVKKSKGRRNGT